MPYEVSFENVPAGISLNAARKDENVQIQYMGNATSEDGEQLILYLGFASACLELVAQNGPRFSPSQVDNMLAIIRKDRSASIYVNELNTLVECRARRTVRPGQAVTNEDIVDITSAKFDKVEIAKDVGYLIVYSSGWRKGVLFDYGPISGLHEPRDYDVWRAFGTVAARLQFQSRFAITNEDWNNLFSASWFPFAGLSHSMANELIGHLRVGWSTDELLPQINAELLAEVDGFLTSWKRKAEFQDHIAFLETAIERFKAKDYLSSVTILFTRIEGILRKYHLLSGASGNRGQDSLSSLVISRDANPYSLLLPHRFSEYLRATYFAGFDEEAGKLDLSRNSVGHGVARPADFDLKAAIIGILICHQLFHIFPTTDKDQQ
jgi:hypothetical protein